MFGGPQAAASLEQLVLEVKELQKSDPLAKAKWIAFTGEKGGGNRDPARHTAEFLTEFMHHLQSGDPGDLVAQIKELQKGDLATKEAWTAYVEAHGEGNRDPARHTPEFLQAFMAHLRSGEKIASESGGAILQAIKTLQSRSHNFKNAWAHFCAEKGHGKNDPAKHDMLFYLKFFEDMARVNGSGGGGAIAAPMVTGGGMLRPSGMVGGMQEPAAKRMRMMTPPASAGGPGIGALNRGMGAHHSGGTLHPGMGGMNRGMGMMGKGMAAGGMMGKGMMTPPGGGFNAVAPPATGNSNASVLAERVKSYQRMGEMQKNAWGAFADTNLGGRRDPTRADANSLSRFIAANNVPMTDKMGMVSGGLSTPMRPPAAAGGGHMATPHMGMIAPQMAGRKMPGIIAPGGMAGMIAPGGGMAGMMAPGGAEKTNLVERIKAFQKAGNQEVWAQFAGSTRDPNKQSVEKLREFAITMGI